MQSGGRIDSNCSEFLLDCIQGYIDRGETKLVIDCSDLEHISSMGLAVLVRAKSRLKKHGGVLAIAGAKGAAADVLNLVHFDRLFGLFGTVEEAAKSVTGA